MILILLVLRQAVIFVFICFDEYLLNKIIFKFVTVFSGLSKYFINWYRTKIYELKEVNFDIK